MFSFGRWTAEHPLPIGVVERTRVGVGVNAGDVVAFGVILGTAIRIAGARHIGLAPDDLPRALRVPIGAEMSARTVIARTGRRFARAVTAPTDGRLLHQTADGDLYFAPILERWAIRSTLDGTVSRSDDARVDVEGDAWSLQGIAAYGPDAIGELSVGVNAPVDELPPSRVQVTLGGRILVGGARISAEVMTRAHACGLAGLVAGGAPAAGLRVVYGDTVSAFGLPGREDRPTVLSLVGFGSAALPREVFVPLTALAGSRAAIHSASARLFVFAAANGEHALDVPDLALAGDYGAVRILPGPCETVGERVFPSEIRTPAIRCGDELLPSANVLPYDGER
jgi:hypothetical protein